MTNNMKRIPVADVCEGEVGKIKYYTREALWKAYEDEDGYYLKARWTLYPVVVVVIVLAILRDTGRDLITNIMKNWWNARQFLLMHYPKKREGEECDN